MKVLNNMEKIFYLNLTLTLTMVSSLTESTTSPRNEKSTTLKNTGPPSIRNTDVFNGSSSTTDIQKLGTTSVQTIETDATSRTTQMGTNIVTSSHEMNGYVTGNSTTANNNTDAQLNVVIIIMIAILGFIIITSVVGGLYVLCWKPTSKGRTPLVECPTEFDVTNPHLYQRNSIMVMFDQTTAVDRNSLTASETAALDKVRAAYTVAGGDEASRRGSSAIPAKSAFENIGYDNGCDA